MTWNVLCEIEITMNKIKREISYLIVFRTENVSSMSGRVHPLIYCCICRPIRIICNIFSKCTTQRISGIESTRLLKYIINETCRNYRNVKFLTVLESHHHHRELIDYSHPSTENVVMLPNWAFSRHIAIQVHGFVALL